ncbi:MAG: hypothetical protein EPO25_17235 [Gammaproteobacteria bacterium]|nr:MAG: hypothetical protein EPO25_17235 [Gammaproteobacteria bacterium]
MRVWTSGVTVLALALAGCGQDEAEPQEPPMAVEDTVFGDLVATQDQARDRTNAALEQHREALKSQLDVAEGSAPEE